ncbi:glycosyltransferase family 2 protein [Haloplanus litoreus]|uniref:glycosyltransferase family 2 protein n=1 Tax=Haloplanus litoreus TaxID=767515 RepID=UPI00360AF259
MPADASGPTEFPDQWHVRLTVSSEHDFPVVVRVCDRLPSALGAPNVALPPDEGEERWTVDTDTVTCRTVVQPGDSTVATYLLHTDATDEAALAGATAIETVQPVDPTAMEIDASANWEPAADHVGKAHGEIRTPDGAAATTGLGNGHAAASDGEGIESILRFETSERAAAESDFLVPRGADTDPLVSIVMPTMNEEAGIRECIERATTALEMLGLPGEIIVSDSSDDRTPEIAAELGAHVVTPDGAGYGYAYRYGFERVRGEFVVIGDADTTCDFEELPKLFECLQRTGADMVMGSRLEERSPPERCPHSTSTWATPC